MIKLHIVSGTEKPNEVKAKMGHRTFHEQQEIFFPRTDIPG